MLLVVRCPLRVSLCLLLVNRRLRLRVAGLRVGCHLLFHDYCFVVSCVLFVACCLLRVVFGVVVLFGCWLCVVVVWFVLVVVVCVRRRVSLVVRCLLMFVVV